MKSQHYLSGTVEGTNKHTGRFHISHAGPILLTSCISIFLMIIEYVFRKTLIKYGMLVSELQYSVDEDLPNFFETIKKSVAQELILENDNMMKNFGFETTDPDTVEGLSRIIMPFKAMQGTPWYQVLSNPSYSFQFNYIGAFVGEREKLIEDGWADERDEDTGEMSEVCRRVRFEQSDMIMILLNLSYIPDEVVRFIDFEPGWSERFKKHMDAFKE